MLGILKYLQDFFHASLGKLCWHQAFPPCTHGLSVQLYLPALSANKALVRILCPHMRIPSQSCTGLCSPASHRAIRGIVRQSKFNADHQIKVELPKHSFHCVVCPHEPSYESYLSFINQHNGHHTVYESMFFITKSEATPVCKLFHS